MSYWAKACKYAYANTSLYSPWKAVPSIVVAVIQQALVSGTAVERTLTVVFITIGVYITLFIIELAFKLLISAPVAIHAEQADSLAHKDGRITQLEDSLKKPVVSALEISRRKTVAEKIASFRQPKDLVNETLKYILEHGDVEPIEFASTHMDSPGKESAVQAIIYQGQSNGLLRASQSQRPRVSIHPDLREALTFHLLGE